MFTFSIKYLKGSTNCAADALSRYPNSDITEEEIMCAVMTAATVAAADEETGRIVDIHQLEEEDEKYRLLQECVANNGWAEPKDQKCLTLRRYFRMRRHLSCLGEHCNCTPGTRGTRG